MENNMNFLKEVLSTKKPLEAVVLEDNEITLVTYYLSDEGVCKRKAIMDDDGKSLHSVPELIAESTSFDAEYEEYEDYEPDYNNLSFFEEVARVYGVSKAQLAENIKRDMFSCTVCTLTEQKGQDIYCKGCSSNPYMDEELLDKLKELI